MAIQYQIPQNSVSLGILFSCETCAEISLRMIFKHSFHEQKFAFLNKLKNNAKYNDVHNLKCFKTFFLYIYIMFSSSFSVNLPTHNFILKCIPASYVSKDVNKKICIAMFLTPKNKIHLNLETRIFVCETAQWMYTICLTHQCLNVTLMNTYITAIDKSTKDFKIYLKES